MLLDCPDDCEAAYSNYISLFLSVFYYVCRDLKELRHMVSLLQHTELLLGIFQVL